MNTEYVWADGAPSQKWFGEWFIAELDSGDRVVLKRLPEDYDYDFTTADATYYRASKIKRWCQFPDSEYKPLAAAPALSAVDDVAVERLAKWFTTHAMSLFRQDGMPVDASLYLDHARAALTAALSGPTINAGGIDSKLIVGPDYPDGCSLEGFVGGCDPFFGTPCPEPAPNPYAAQEKP